MIKMIIYDNNDNNDNNDNIFLKYNDKLNIF